MHGAAPGMEMINLSPDTLLGKCHKMPQQVGRQAGSPRLEGLIDLLSGINAAAILVRTGSSHGMEYQHSKLPPHGYQSRLSCFLHNFPSPSFPPARTCAHKTPSCVPLTQPQLTAPVPLAKCFPLGSCCADECGAALTSALQDPLSCSPDHVNMAKCIDLHFLPSLSPIAPTPRQPWVEVTDASLMAVIAPLCLTRSLPQMETSGEWLFNWQSIAFYCAATASGVSGLSCPSLGQQGSQGTKHLGQGTAEGDLPWGYVPSCLLVQPCSMCLHRLFLAAQFAL